MWKRMAFTMLHPSFSRVMMVVLIAFAHLTAPCEPQVFQGSYRRGMCVFFLNRFAVDRLSRLGGDNLQVCAVNVKSFVIKPLAV